MKKILILGNSLVSSELIETARNMGCYTIVTDNLSPDLSTAKKEADEYWMISTGDVDLLEQKCREENIDAVFAGVSEFNLDRVKELTDRLGLPCYINESSWKYARDKSAFKEKCKEAGIPVVEEYSISDPPAEEELAEVEYPVVVKPVDGTGNKGLSICHNRDELLKGLEKARKTSESGSILIERYIRGEETWRFYYLTEEENRYVYSGRIFRQPGYPTFLYSFGSSAVEVSREFKENISVKCVELLKNIGCDKGIAWFQFIRDENGKYYALEMAQRMSAGTSGKAMENAIGVNAIEWMLDTALGKKHTAEMLPPTAEPPYRSAHCVYCMFAERDGTISSIQGFNELEGDNLRVSIVTPEKTRVEKYRLMAMINFRAKNGREMCDIIREINSKTRILDENNENLYIQYTDYDRVLERHKGLFCEE